jgi:hypothetical protein
MTAAKSLQRKEVERVAVALLDLLKAECPDFPEYLFFDPLVSPPIESERGRVVLDAYRLAWSASARFTRRDQTKRAKARAQGEAFFDDKRINLAIVSLEHARALVRKANQALMENIAQLEKEAARHGFGVDLADHPEHVQVTERIVGALDTVVSKLKTFKGIPQARNRGEWDTFISTTAERLLEVGFSSREVAALLTGRKPDKVDRATLERFRQRVRRLQISSG